MKFNPDEANKMIHLVGHPDELGKLRDKIDEAIASRNAHNEKLAAEASHVKLNPAGDTIGLAIEVEF